MLWLCYRETQVVTRHGPVGSYAVISKDSIHQFKPSPVFTTERAKTSHMTKITNCPR